MDFCNHNLKGDERVLEIGSGTGFLRRTMPYEVKEWVQLEPQIAFLEEAKRRFPEGSYICGYAGEIPFPDESFDVVCGYGSCDVLINLNKDMKEAHRVLKKGGLFFHMLDLHPCDKPIIKDFEDRHNPIQEFGNYKSCSYLETESISYIPEDRLEEYDKLEEIISKDSYSERTEKKIHRFWKKYGEKINTHDYFDKKIIQALSDYNFNSIEKGKLTAGFKGKRTEQQREQEERYFVFFNDAGKYSLYPDSTMYNIFQLKFPAMLNPLPMLHESAYRTLNHVFPSLARKIEPSCLEVSSIRYVKARK
ncbi:class I SAM-dependent methyltransferase [Candidatus Woesearchaeota archaeon]|nr:class I SAM-dependent methyltransferase [Candidatus Woesearchaeota archaeon]